ncbi:MAG TPA: O-methyltransferase [Chthonomonadaceae bacterium]|nr:O-methyltransferase [Chthonomonadaceae bacterium]
MPVEPMPADLLEYSSSLFAPDDATLREMTRAAAEFGMPAGWEITPDVGRLFQVLCRAVGARRVLEFGTLAGHSALCFARALPADGRVVSIERDSRYAAFAREQLARAGVDDRVDVRVGDALESLPVLSAEAAKTGDKFDVIFLDADKAHYPEMLEWSVEVLRPGGLLLADNVLRAGSWGGQTLLDPRSDDPRILAIRAFNARLAADPRFLSVIVPMRAGVAVALYEG